MNAVENVKLFGNNVLIGPLIQKRVTDSGLIHLPIGRTLWDGDQKQWVVLAIGPGRRTKKGVLIPPEVKVGDRVIFNPQFQHGIRHTFEDGSRWSIVDAGRLEMTW
jgi:co-chaperonin GroES (HSP10)